MRSPRSDITFPQPVRAVIFDMDGLLVDTERIYFDALLRACASVGHEMTEAFARSMIGVPGAECVAMIEAHYGSAFPMDIFGAEYDRLVAARLEQGIPPRTGAKELVRLLVQRGIPQAVASSSRRPTVERYLRGVELIEHFSVLVCREDVVRPKPDPEPFLTAARLLDVPPEQCLVLEDSYHGIAAAHAAGAMPIMVPDMLVPTDEVRTRCIAIAEDLEAVRRLLDEAIMNQRPGGLW
jgi:HAD superfamily hydrolase (TIGR01509 family)